MKQNKKRKDESYDWSPILFWIFVILLIGGLLVISSNKNQDIILEDILEQGHHVECGYTDEFGFYIDYVYRNENNTCIWVIRYEGEKYK